MSSSPLSKGQLVRTVRLGDAGIDAVLDRLDNAETDQDGKQRSGECYTYRIKNSVMHIQQPGDASSVPYLVATRNIGAGGVSILHGGFVHIGSRSVIQLISIRGSWENIPGVIKHCRYIEDGLHEVGMSFDQAVDPARFCQSAVTYQVLLVDDDLSVVRLATHLLTQLGSEVDHAENGRVGVDKALEKDYHLILMDMDMPVLNGFEAVKELREGGYTGRIVASTAMTQPADRQRCLDAGCDGYISKPLVRQELATLLESLRREPLLSSFNSDASMADIIEEFVQELLVKLRAIEQAQAEGNVEELKALARSLKGEAGGYGFGVITEEAKKIEESLMNEVPISEVKTHIDSLATLCMQVRSSAKRT